MALRAVMGAAVAAVALGSSNAGATAVVKSTSGSGGDIVCFGDSWAAFACDTLAGVVALDGKSNKVNNKGVAGSTATFWANDTTLMLAQVLSSGIPEFMWLSIGGDDILDGYAQHICNMTAAGQARCNALIFDAMDTMLGALFAELPLLQVGIFGYDFTNFQYSTECLVLAATVFGANVTQEAINGVFMSYAADVLTPLAAKYNLLNFQYTPLWGLLQATGGVAYTPAPYPNLAYPSPEYLMNDGCIHASALGWDALMAGFYNSYLKGRL